MLALEGCFVRHLRRNILEFGVEWIYTRVKSLFLSLSLSLSLSLADVQARCVSSLEESVDKNGCAYVTNSWTKARARG